MQDVKFYIQYILFKLIIKAIIFKTTDNIKKYFSKSIF
jgi:hypothetical protein